MIHKKSYVNILFVQSDPFLTSEFHPYAALYRKYALFASAGLYTVVNLLCLCSFNNLPMPFAILLHHR